MIVDIVIHVMFQVVLASIMFWFIIIPTCKKTVKAHTEDIIDKSIHENILSPDERMLLNTLVKKEDVYEILSKKDPHAFENNVRVLLINICILFAFLTLGFITLLYFSCKINMWPIVVEIVVTYSIVFTAQLLFVKYVITNYYPTSETDMLRYISASINKSCSVS